MYNIDFKKPLHVHFIGIGGISMSGLAEILLKENFTISGSDTKPSALTEHLVSLGATVDYPQKPENITDNIEVVVYTAAIHEDNPELMEVRRRNIPTLTRAKLLGQLMKNYKTPIAIAGTHGKTTTTSMMSHILLAAEKDPTVSVGGILKAIGGNIRVGNSDIFITEACEYTNSFLDFFPKISVILNVEEDHMDFFKDIDDIRHSFHRFAALLPEDGALIMNKNIEKPEAITDGLSCKVITYSEIQDADYSAANIAFDNLGNVSFDLMKYGQYAGCIQLSVAGHHNVANALSAIAVSDQLGIDLEAIQRGLLSFTGTNRRFEYKGEVKGITVIDDYAHHPTEIRATLTSAKNYPHREIWCVFQPHTYTRTKAFFHEFAEALSLADHVVLADIYAARETDTLGITSEALAEEIKKLGTDAYYLPSFDEIKNFALEKCIHGDVLITMGAGDVVNIGDSLLR